MKKIFIHIVSWLLCYALLIWFIAQIRFLQHAFVLGSVIILLQIAIFYLNAFVFMPFFLEKKRVVLYAVAILLSFTIAISIGGEVSKSLSTPLYYQADTTNAMPLPEERIGREPPKPIHTLKEKRRKTKRLVYHLTFNGVPLLFVLFLSTLYRNRQQQQKREKTMHLAVEAESKFLKSQINPHFLFNSLNNIYSLSQMKSDKTPDAIHKLSDMLRYVLYESSSEQVALGEEVKYIIGYIDLFKLKDDTIENITFEYEEVEHNYLIAPMILLPFVENAFKHSKIEDVENGWIQIRLKSKENKIEFFCENSKPDVPHNKDKQGGIGLQNVKRRLELLYPQQHELYLLEDEKSYRVKLILQEIETKTTKR